MFSFFRKTFRIVIVCHANETRSPFIAALLRNQLSRSQETLKQRVVVESAGMNAADGAPLHPVVAAIAFQRGVPIGDHQARRITARIVKKADLILTVEAKQQAELAVQYPIYAGKIHTVAGYGRDGEPGEDIVDPTGLDEDQYKEFINRTEAEASRIATHLALVELAKN